MSKTSNKSSLSGYLIAIVGVCLVMTVLVLAMKRYTAAPQLDQARVKERLKASQEVKAAAELELNNYARLDATKGLYRLKIGQAMNLTEQMYRSPQAARTNLISRAEKANFVPPPPTFE